MDQACVVCWIQRWMVVLMLSGRALRWSMASRSLGWDAGRGEGCARVQAPPVARADRDVEALGGFGDGSR
ncbi:hypothetical protein [Streptomyces resistomycificus]|uniref:Uncharacterized protein n=1 Tax=Streptomyces resistomycificus TaxID=67356 RepID=A0A0L8L4F4_9ACTN|nr:hypothetical protein [Streptomyces resistomycificus]KOG33027.1 hypothetical protein ADK37_24400 [Streptomyces resistomycificus]